ncbi:serine hydrolase domain-containing protein [Pseudoalteromonas sp. MMG005]|uniref:serine hydrolase domain-containing protein n=1 Tax=Pseudoalteromonas sp. MMG005 TaxID=2822682 RepID=UPI0032B48608
MYLNIKNGLVHSIIVFITLTLLIACGSDSSSYTEQPKLKATEPELLYGKTGDEKLHEELEAIRTQYNMPALAAFIVSSDALLEMDVSGYRISGQPTLVTTEDRWSIGSFTKSITATVASRLVEQGLISLESDVLEIFPELSGKIKPEYEHLTLRDLLSMTSGLKRDLDSMFTGQWHMDQRSMTEQRYSWTIELLNTEPETTKGTFLYSNAGYVLAGHMLERVTGQSWEALVAQEIAVPLEMNLIDFGTASFMDPDNQPSGHQIRDGQWHAITAADRVSLPKVIGPAGTINTNLHDLSLYLQAHLSGAMGKGNIVSTDSYAHMHSPVSESYGLGWILKENNQFHHNGFTGSFYLDNLIIPEENIALLAVTNGSTTQAREAVEQAIAVMLERYNAQ